MKVKTITKFNDKLANTTREVGEEFEVEVERYEQIMAYRPDLIEPIEDEPPADPAADAEEAKAEDAATSESGEADKAAEGSDPDKAEQPKGEEDEKAAEGSDPQKGGATDEAAKPKGEEAKEASSKETNPAAKKTQRKNASK